MAGCGNTVGPSNIISSLSFSAYVNTPLGSGEDADPHRSLNEKAEKGKLFKQH